MFRNEMQVVGRAIVIGAGAVGVMGVSANADDWTPPPWERFKPYTTFQEWDFDEAVSPNGSAPDGDIDGNWFNEGKPGDTPLAYNGGGVAWDNGILYGSGNGNSYIDFFCPNWIDKEPLKIVWIQIHGNWGPTHSDGPIFVSNVFGYKDGSPVAGSLFNSNDNDAVHLTDVWTIEPNPDYEWIRVFFPEGAQVTQVVIDTISFPAPGAVGAFGLAGLAVMRRRR